MDNFDFNESAYIARQSEATENGIFAPEISTPDYTVTENPSITPRPEPRAVPDENGNGPRENDEARPAPVISDDGNADKTHENGEMRPEPRRKHPHRGNKGDRMGGDRKSDGTNTERSGGSTERDGRPRLNRGDGSAPNGEHRPVPLPHFPENDGNRNPETRPAPHENDGAEKTERAKRTEYAEDSARADYTRRTERARLGKYAENAEQIGSTEHAGQKNVVSDGAFRPLPQGGLTDKIVPRALTANESVATDAALANDSVAAARAIETEDGLLVAVLLDPVFLVSERRELKEELKCDIEQATGKQTLVTYDLGVYRKIKPDMSSEAKAALYAAVTARN